MHVYFSGIGGVALGPLALICRDAGYKVSGSDYAESRLTRQLQAKGIDVAITQDETHIATVHSMQPIDWLIVTAAAKSDNAELQFALSHNIRVSKRAEMLNHILHEKHLQLIAVSGTHGKTTVTGMTVWLFKQFKQPVSYSVGTSLSFGEYGAYDPRSIYFIYECDEFDRNMLAFHPTLSLITTINYDHIDTYPTQAEYDDAFRHFIAQSQEVFAWQHDVLRLGLAHPRLDQLRSDDPHIAQIKLPGEHNRRNAWQATQAFAKLFPHFSVRDIIAKINEFPGTDRRFERLADNLYTDYAHHPDEIRATLQLASELSPHVIVVYQPHQNTRQHQIATEYRDCFAKAKKIYWLPTYLSRENTALPILSPQALIANINNPSAIEPAEMNQQLADKLQQHRKNGELVVLMGAGSIDEWARGLA